MLLLLHSVVHYTFVCSFEKNTKILLVPVQRGGLPSLIFWKIFSKNMCVEIACLARHVSTTFFYS